MDTFYVKATRVSHNFIEVNLETLLVVNVFKLCDTNNVKLLVVVEDDLQPQFKLFLNNFEVVDDNDVLKIAKYCVWPVIVVGKTVVAGLCSVARQLIKSSCNESVQHLLGFREACLMACSESSIWTKFCEIDMVNTVKNVLQSFNSEDSSIKLPADLTRFEYHMEQPVRIHNVYKVAREKNNDKDIKSSVPLKDLNLAHTFSEGPFITLSDILLYPCLKILITFLNENVVKDYLPLTYAWYKNIQLQNLEFIEFEAGITPLANIKEIQQHEILRQSLYTSDPNRYKPQNRIYTKQNDIENSLEIINKSNISVFNETEPYGNEIPFNWENIPLEANPEGGALPKKRANRKCEQLENLAKAVVKIAENNSYIIVDFCSGSGHLGILLATLLPRSEIILVENKERSLIRAKERIYNLNLNNVILLQSNLDYFKGTFDIGVSLHACGVATDLVIQNCIENKAHFVSCPCCYGGIHDCYHLQYPRSDEFNKIISYGDYLNLAHAADQTHDNDNAKTKQGYVCMDIVDTDRKLYAERFGYKVFLGKLIPTTCTPKNNLIVGICK